MTGMWCCTLLPKIWNMSLTAGVVILCVLAARLLLRRAPKAFSYALWAVVLFRLLCPVSLSSGLSLFSLVDAPVSEQNTIEYIPPNIVHMEAPEVTLPVPGVGAVIHGTLPQSGAQQTAGPLETPLYLAAMVWLLGIAALLIYSVVSLLRLKRKLVGSALLRDNIRLADGIGSPFVIGLFRPKIYLPSSLSEGEREYIILHEQYHIRRGDHIVKLLAFAALCVHWFNPLVWLAFFLSGKDMEMSCDEAVLRKMGPEIRGAYSQSLLSLATGRRVIGGTPLAFGEGDTGSRVKNALKWKKPAVWIVALAVLVCAAVILVCALNPQKDEAGGAENDTGTAASEGMDDAVQTEPLDAAVSAAVWEFVKQQSFYENNSEWFCCESHLILDTQLDPAGNGGDTEQLTVYAVAAYNAYEVSDQELTVEWSWYIPAAILTFAVTDGDAYTLSDFWTPRDGAYYAEDVMDRFPRALWDDVCDDIDKREANALALDQACRAQAVRYSGVDTGAVIARLFEEIASSPAEASYAGAYINAHAAEHRELLCYGDYTLRYIFSQFFAGGQTGLNGHLMRIVMDELIGGEAINLAADTGQEYFDAWLASARQVRADQGDGYMQERMPKSWLLLQTVDSILQEASLALPE